MTTVATFTIEYYRILNAQGNLEQSLPEFAQDPKTLLHLYRTMVLTRVFDTKAVALQRTGKLGTYPANLGQEAIGVGIGHAMRKEDVFCPAYREYGAQLQRGVKMSEILTYWGGDERGSNYANNSEDFPLSVPIGSQSLHAAGVATAFKIRKQARVAVMACGDGATSQGDFYETLNLTGVWHLPLVIVVSNNQWAISVPRAQQSATQTLAQKAIAAGFPGEQVDGNDVIAVRDRIGKALEKARQGGGPTLIEAVTYRLHDHTTADDATRYRSKAELEKAWQEEPILRLRNFLIAQGHWSQQQEEALQAECSTQVEQAVQEYLNLPPQPVTVMFDYLYAKLPKELQEQRETAIAYAEQGEHHHG